MKIPVYAQWEVFCRGNSGAQVRCGRIIEVELTHANFRYCEVRSLRYWCPSARTRSSRTGGLVMRRLRAASSSRTWVWIVGRLGEPRKNQTISPIDDEKATAVPCSCPCPAQLELSPVELDLITATSPAVDLRSWFGHATLSFSSFSLPANWAKSLKTPPQ